MGWTRQYILDTIYSRRFDTRAIINHRNLTALGILMIIFAIFFQVAIVVGSCVEIVILFIGYLLQRLVVILIINSISISKLSSASTLLGQIQN